VKKKVVTSPSKEELITELSQLEEKIQDYESRVQKRLSRVDTCKSILIKSNSSCTISTASVRI
jgi:flagellar biosynthesis chaperone FliJ